METLTVTACERQNNTPSGNPRYLLSTDTAGSRRYVRTAPDTQAAHNLPPTIYPGMTTPATIQVKMDDQGQITQFQEG